MSPRFLWTVIAIAIGVLCGIYFGAYYASAQEHRIALKGTLFFAGPPEECHFILDPQGDFETIDLTALQEGYVCDFLAGFNAKEFEVTVGSQSK